MHTDYRVQTVYTKSQMNSKYVSLLYQWPISRPVTVKLLLNMNHLENLWQHRVVVLHPEFLTEATGGNLGICIAKKNCTGAVSWIILGEKCSKWKKHTCHTWVNLMRMRTLYHVMVIYSFDSESSHQLLPQRNKLLKLHTKDISYPQWQIPYPHGMKTHLLRRWCSHCTLQSCRSI